MGSEHSIEAILGVEVAAGRMGPIDPLGENGRERLRAILAKPPGEALADLRAEAGAARVPPSDPAHPWRDPHVQNCARRYLNEVVLEKWTKDHPHKPCGNIRVDDWGRTLCRYINPNNGIDGPWENPTHFLFYAYNTFAAYVAYGITLNGFLVAFCDIQLS